MHPYVRKCGKSLKRGLLDFSPMLLQPGLAHTGSHGTMEFFSASYRLTGPFPLSSNFAFRETRTTTSTTRAKFVAPVTSQRFFEFSNNRGPDRDLLFLRCNSAESESTVLTVPIFLQTVLLLLIRVVVSLFLYCTVQAEGCSWD
jgi:hypothetical protein